MSWAKRQLETTRGAGNVFTIGEGNPLIGRDIRVTWKRPWGKKPEGHTVRGFLLRTFVVGGRACLAELEAPGPAGGVRHVRVPWSRNYLDIEVMS